MLTYEFEECFEKGCDSHDQKLIDLVKNELIEPRSEDFSSEGNKEYLTFLKKSKANESPFIEAQIMISKVRETLINFQASPFKRCIFFAVIGEKGERIFH